MVDFSTFNTQILCLPSVIISKARYKINIIMYRLVTDSVTQITVINENLRKIKCYFVINKNIALDCDPLLKNGF